MEGGQHHGPRPEAGSPTSVAVEDYAKAIFALERRGGGPVSNSGLARRLGVSPASVTAMLKRMADLGLVEREPYQGATLTADGRQIALEVLRHHRLIESYLADVLGMPWDRVHDEAEVLEHYISEELEERIAQALGNPSVDPHGDPIPGPELAMETPPGVPLADVELGTEVTLARVSDADSEMLRYLAELGIRPGVRMRVAEHDRIGGSMLLELNGSRHTLGERATRRMVVTVA
jgi:DtxR family Mn-dependent transcriptional regulator